MALIIYRYMFLDLDPSEMGPPYWVDLGAVAISTLAGAILIGNLAKGPLLIELAPFMKGFTFSFWSVATWWIPILLVLGFWRHVIRRFPLRYDPSYWAMVFPLGMYTV
ncbi:MAG: tellurite resistance protein TehA-like permease, partial [Yoonia sp.]